MERILLNGIWNLHGRDEKGRNEDVPVIDAAVPGMAQLTLSENGYLPSDCRNTSVINFSYDTSGDFADWYNVEIEIEGECGDSNFSVRKTARGKVGTFDIPVKSPKLWWPYGYGEL